MLKKVWKWWEFQGRATRTDFWIMAGVTLAAGTLLYLIRFKLVYSAPPLVIQILSVVWAIARYLVLWFYLSTIVRRFHDRDMSGWWTIPLFVLPLTITTVFFAPGMGVELSGLPLVLMLIGAGLLFWCIVELGFLKGTDGPNRYDIVQPDGEEPEDEEQDGKGRPWG